MCKLPSDGVRSLEFVLQKVEGLGAEADLIRSEGDRGGAIGREIEILGRWCGGGSGGGVAVHGGSPAGTRASSDEVPQLQLRCIPHFTAVELT